MRKEQFSISELEVGKVTVSQNETDTGKGLSKAIWSDCNILNMLVDPYYGHVLRDDFIQTTGTHFTTANNYILAGANGTFAKTAADQNGVALLTAPGTDNDEAYIQLNTTVGVIKLDATTDWWFEARVKINQITTAQGVFVGLLGDAAAIGADFMTDNTMALKALDYIGFHAMIANDGACIFDAVHSITSQHRISVKTAIHTPTAATSWIKFGMKSKSGVNQYFVNGLPCVTTVLTSAHDYPLNKYCMPAFGTKCGSAAANTLSIDWWQCAQLRA